MSDTPKPRARIAWFPTRSFNDKFMVVAGDAALAFCDTEADAERIVRALNAEQHVDALAAGCELLRNLETTRYIHPELDCRELDVVIAAHKALEQIKEARG